MSLWAPIITMIVAVLSNQKYCSLHIFVVIVVDEILCMFVDILTFSIIGWAKCHHHCGCLTQHLLFIFGQTYSLYQY